MSDIPKVFAATAALNTEKQIELAMMTTERVEVKFLLDDLSGALLSLTLGTALQARKAEAEKGDEHINLFSGEVGK